MMIMKRGLPEKSSRAKSVEVDHAAARQKRPQKNGTEQILKKGGERGSDLADSDFMHMKFIRAGESGQ